MKVLIVGHGEINNSELAEISKNFDAVVIKSKEIDRPKEEVFLITAPPIIEYKETYYPIKEQQPWRQRMKSNWKNKRRK